MSKLNILKEDQVQDCSSCPNQSKCWTQASNTSDEALVINLLVCRMKRGIDVNNSTKLLLKLLRPRTLKTAQYIVSQLGSQVQMDDVILDVESAIVESLMTKYKLEERAWPLHFLFAPRPETIHGWAGAYVRKAKLYQHRFGGEEPEEIEDESPNNDMLSSINSLVEHKGLLTPLEYRIFKFCITNADSKLAKPFGGLHTFLAQQLGVSRGMISQKFKSASDKIRAIYVEDGC